MRGIIFLVLAVLLVIVGLTEGNWYGKRGDKIDDEFEKYLQSKISQTISHGGLEAKSTLSAIARLVRDWEDRLLDHNRAETIVDRT
ncbi:hypothetical protein ScPMuIL_009785 [Solemya velum]